MEHNIQRISGNKSISENETHSAFTIENQFDIKYTESAIVVFNSVEDL
jgi:hypothetical protein